jgi:hypothetical protein
MRLPWQAFIAMLVVGSVVTSCSWLIQSPSADFGMNGHSVGKTYVVTDIDPRGPASRAGLRAGDVLALPRTFPEKVRWADPRVGDRVTMRRANGEAVTLEAQGSPVPTALLLVVIISRLSFLVVAGIVAWRLPGDPAARALATFLACFGAGLRIGNTFWGPESLRFAEFLSNEALFLIGFGALALFTSRFPAQAADPWRRAFARSIVPLVLIGTALSVTRLVSVVIFEERVWVRPLLTTYVFLIAAILGASIASLIVSYRQAHGAQKLRVLWTLRTFAAGFSGFIPMLIFVSLGLYGEPWVQYLPLTIVLIPVGLSYVILRHKVLDIGFVVNSAVVYTTVSLIVVGVFITFEWFIGHVVEVQGSASTVLQLGAALALGMSTRFIHARVDHYVDDLFFRERHQAEAAIRRFAHETLLITDANDLTAKTVDVAQANAHLNGAAYYARRNGAFVAVYATFERAPEVSENDYAVLAMRTWHHSVDLPQHDTQIPGEVAFPMIVRGRLDGFLACGEKASHEALAPDERDALGLLARDAGIALDSLRIRDLETRLRVAGLVASE